MRPRSVAALLARRWMLSLALLGALFAGIALVLLFVLEDSFIDRRLHALASAIAAGEPALPPGFTLVPQQAAPDEIRARLAGAPPGAIREFRLRDGRYVHALKLRGRGGGDALLVYDATDELTVTTGVARAWPFLFGLFCALACAALLLAWHFVRGIEHRAAQLIGQVRGAESPAALRAYADTERLRELADVARLMADAWEQRLAALQRERDTLAFLAHELRTPLQSARTSLALLDDPARRGNAVARLRRAVDRLARAGDAVLWLSSDAPAERESTALRPLLDELANAYAPLAATRGQTVQLDCDPSLHWRGPGAVLETIAGNLLLNAIQHGGAGTIAVEANAQQLCVSNPAGTSPQAGFGIGLQIVARLCERCGWRLRHSVGAGTAAYRIERDAGDAATT